VPRVRFVLKALLLAGWSFAAPDAPNEMGAPSHAHRSSDGGDRSDIRPPARDWPGVKVSDPVTVQALRRALDEASRRIVEPNCQSLLIDFRDRQDRPLRDRLATFGVDVREYLSWIQFHDGSDSPWCNGSTLLYTSTGSRVVRVCALVVNRAGWKDPNLLAASVIHEMLHTLGLGENPPSSKEITARVRRRCWAGGRPRASRPRHGTPTGNGDRTQFQSAVDDLVDDRVIQA
jgi:hypothetical protein